MESIRPLQLLILLTKSEMAVSLCTQVMLPPRQYLRYRQIWSVCWWWFMVNGVNVNQSLIKAGYAWQYRKYCKESFCNDWIRLENQARNSKLGLWADKHPEAPWDYRKAKRSGTSSNTESNLIQRPQEGTTAMLRAMCSILRAVEIITVRIVWRALGVSRRLWTLGIDLAECVSLDNLMWPSD